MNKIEADKLYKIACDYYNQKDYHLCLERLIDLYRDYGFADENLFSLVSTQLMLNENLDDEETIINICCIHSSCFDLYNDEQKELMYKSLIHHASLCKSRKLNPPNFIKALLKDKLPKTISFMIDNLAPTNNISKLIDYDKLKNKTVINCYYNQSNCAIGDFLRGSCYLFDTLENKGVNLQISFQNHDISNYITSIFDEESTVLFDVDRIIDCEDLNKELCFTNNYIENIEKNIVNALAIDCENICLFSNYHSNINMEPLSYECKKFMQSNIIFSDEVENIFKELDVNNEYEIAHVRLGDHATVKYDYGDSYNINTKKYDVDFLKLLKSIHSKQLDSDRDMFVLSDSNDFKQYVIKSNIPRINVHHLNSIHSSDNPGFIQSTSFKREDKVSNMLYTALDMKILSMSKNINSFSVYPWGSGFCFWLSKIYDIPIKVNKLI